MNTYTSFTFTLFLIVPQLGAHIQSTSYDRVQHGQRGLIKGAAALTGCAALWFLGNAAFTKRKPVRQFPFFEAEAEPTMGPANLSYFTLGLAAFSYVVYMLGRSSQESPKLYFSAASEEQESSSKRTKPSDARQTEERTDTSP